MAGQFQIGVFNLGTRNAQLVSPSGGQDPVWTCDSRHLVYSNNGRLYLLDTKTKQSLPISTAASSCSEPTVTR